MRGSRHYHPFVADDLEFRHVAGRQALVRCDLPDSSVDELWGDGVALPHAKGRGGVGLLELGAGLQGVCRDYRRGGALGFLLPRSYLDGRRAERELRILANLHRRGVPVVRPLAALARRHLLVFFRLRLITELVAGARPLPGFLHAHPELRNAALQAAGRVVGEAFGAGLRHPDLHPDNLVARDVGGEVEVRLLDLDRATLQDRLTPDQQDRMLLRMARYLRRHAADLPITPRAVDILRFLAGMALDRAARRETLGRLRPLYVEELRRHGLTDQTLGVS